MSSVCPNGHTSTADDYCDVCGAPIDPTQQASPARSGPAVGTTGMAGAGGATGTSGTAAGGTSGANLCPHCGTENVAEALFCEACGYDFTTGTLPRSDVPEAPADAQSGPSPAPDSAADSSADPAGAVTAAGGAAVASSGGTSTPDSDFQFVAEVWIDPAWYQAQQSPDPLPSPGLPEIVPLRKSSVLVGRVSRSRNIHPEIDCEPDSGASRRQCQLTTDGTRWWVEDLESANGTFVAGASDPLPGSPIAVGLKQEIQPGDRIYVGAWTRIVVRAATVEEQEGLT